MFKVNKLAFALCALGASQILWAEGLVELPSIQVTVEQEQFDTNLLGKRQNVSDQTVESKTLKQRATTLGDALDGELGIHSNQFGGGASAPIIRGQEGKRIKILANNADVVDMANMSPDHAISVDASLAKHIEIVRGASTLLYSSGNSAGVINVIDHKIPTTLPKNGLEAEAGFRFNTANNEKLTTLGTTIGLGKNLAVRLEGLHRDAGNYHTPNFQQPIYELDDNKKLTTHYNSVDYLPESWAKSQVGTFGLSWLGKHGYLGASITERREKYGLPAHSHAYEDCHVDSIRQSLLLTGGKPFLKLYPFLAYEKDIDYDNIGITCHTDDDHNHDHDHASPYIDLKSTRYEVRGELKQPLTGIDKIRVSASRTDYRHNEIEGDEVGGFFKNTANVARLEFSHQPISGLTGVWGVQYMDSKNSATSIPTCTPIWPSPTCTPNTQNMLHNNQSKTWSVFGLEQYQWKDVTIEASARMERSKVTMLENRVVTDELIDEYYCRPNPNWTCRAIGPDGTYIPFTTVDARNYVDDLLKPHKETAYSYGLGGHWKFTPNHTLSLNYSHQERVPNAQELYAHGMHLATNSFEIGNNNLTKEKSNNFEIGLAYQGDRLDYKLATYLYDFDNYIYLLAMNDGRGPRSIKQNAELKANRYMQSPARFYGVEAKVGYQFNDIYYASIFADYVHGKLVDMPDIIDTYQPARNYFGGRTTPEVITYKSQPDRYTPRLPPMRLGAKVKANFDEKWSGELEYVRTFDQNKVSKFESETKGHHLLNVGLDYDNVIGTNEYSIFFKANNLLDQKVYAHETHLPYIPQMGRNFSLGVNWKF